MKNSVRKNQTPSKSLNGFRNLEILTDSMKRLKGGIIISDSLDI